jgi:cephalosporin-C deacetylase
MNGSTPYLADDFDDFWKETVDEVKDLPVDYSRSWRNDYDWQGFRIETLTFASVGGRRINGWIAIPHDVVEHIEPTVDNSAASTLNAERSALPAFLWIPPYGRESLLPNEYGTRKGFVSLSLNFFGEHAFHQEKYRIERGYFAEGAEDPRTWVFRRMFQDAYMAFRVLQAQHEVDENRCASMGMSQGAGISIWLGAMCEGVNAVCADMAFLCAIKHTLQQPVHRYPLKELIDFMKSIPLGEERVFNTVSYFDTMNMATRCKVPTHVTLGLKDPAARPDNVRAMYNALAADKKEKFEIDWGHDWHPTMIETNRLWLLDHL